jgi:cysteine desulfurase
MFGGSQQRRMRPGTLAVDLIAGLGEAASVARRTMAGDLSHLSALKQQLTRGLQDIDGLHINGPSEGGYPGILNVGVKDVEGESLLHALEPLCVATGSACNSQSLEPSYVLRAIGRSDLEAQSAIRFSLGHLTTPDDIETAISLYCQAVRKLRSMTPGAAL